MKTNLIIIATQAILTCSAFAQQTHFDIKIPDARNNGFFGPVKEIVTEYSYNMSDRKYKEIRQYDETGNLKSRTKWDRREKIIYFATNTFDEAGCFIRQRVEDMREKTTNDYEIVLNIPARKIAYSDKITGAVEVIEYDESKHALSTLIKEKSAKPMPLSAYKRGPDSQPKIYTRYEDGRVKYTISYEWNDQKLKSRTLFSDKKAGRKELNIYEYLVIDEHGNWTQCLMQCLDLNKDKETIFEKLSKRTIEYYEDRPEENEP